LSDAAVNSSQQLVFRLKLSAFRTWIL